MHLIYEITSQYIQQILATVNKKHNISICCKEQIPSIQANTKIDWAFTRQVITKYFVHKGTNPIKTHAFKCITIHSHFYKLGLFYPL